MSASWKADPTGRHQLRWWDGQNWTDHVADDGVTSTDPYEVPPPIVPPPIAPPVTPPPADDRKGTVVFAAQPAAPTSSPPSSPPVSTPPPSPASTPGAPSYLSGGGAPAMPMSTPPKKKSPLIPIVGGVVVVIVLIVVLVFVVGGGGDDGPTSTTGEIRDEEVLALRVSGDQGDVVIVDARPTDDLDLVFGLLVTRDQLRDFYDEFAEFAGSDLSFSDFESGFRSADDFDLGDLQDDFEGGTIIQEGDSSGDGGRERGWLVLPTDGDYAIVAFAYDGVGSGDAEISIERCADRVSIEDLIDAEDSDEEYDLAQEACGDTRVPYNS